MAELKIKQVWNDKGETFFPEDIDDKVKRDQMGPELFDVEFNPVCAHPRKGDHRSHFKLNRGPNGRRRTQIKSMRHTTMP